jgi:O-phospho-L-seryl-tRNASec:L-selenocysteinyl-tRNA synthase
MDEANCKIASQLISQTYINQGSQALTRRHKVIKTLLSQRRLPVEGWDDATIELFIQDASLMDSNNFIDNVGLGEREARVASELVARRHYRLAHGIGRSGEVAAEQPKAAGSSLLAKLTNHLASDALEIAGMKDLGPVLTLPLATGMALTMTLLALREDRPEAKYVLWPRIDQKTCLKCITAAGYTPIVVPMKLEGDQVVTDVDAVNAVLAKIENKNTIACILTTTSCFAPRTPDNIIEIARLCALLDIPHVINNAYGVQSANLCALITSALRKHRVDAIIQSTDKNFMVPVGGAIIAAPKNRSVLVEKVNKLYPGRASMAPLLDLLITLLHWGAAGWRRELQQREELQPLVLEALKTCAAEIGERVLVTLNNPISMAMTLDSLESSVATAGGGSGGATFLGSMLFARGASGARVIVPGKQQSVAGIQFQSYGASYDTYPHSYVTVAAAIGSTQKDIDEFLKRLRVCVDEFKRKQAKNTTNTSDSNA